MNIIQILAVGIRVLGIFVILVTLRDLPQWAVTMQQAGVDYTTGEADLTAYYYFIVFTIIVLGVALLMIVFPETLSKKLVRNSEAKTELSNIKLESVQLGGLFLLGAYILSWAIPDLVHNGLYVWQLRNTIGLDIEPAATYKNLLIVTLVEIVIGIYLMFGSKGLVNIVKNFRK